MLGLPQQHESLQNRLRPQPMPSFTMAYAAVYKQTGADPWSDPRTRPASIILQHNRHLKLSSIPYTPLNANHANITYHHRRHVFKQPEQRPRRYQAPILLPRPPSAQAAQAHQTEAAAVRRRRIRLERRQQAPEDQEDLRHHNAGIRDVGETGRDSLGR